MKNLGFAVCKNCKRLEISALREMGGEAQYLDAETASMRNDETSYGEVKLSVCVIDACGTWFA
jgi:hypothetical protein